MDEETRVIRKVIKIDSDTLACGFYFLRMNVLCNIFVLEHPELNLPFPMRGNVGLCSGYFGHGVNEDVLENVKNENIAIIRIKNSQSYNKKLIDFLHGEDFENIDIRDKESFKKVYDYFCILELYYDKITKSRKPEMYLPISQGGLYSIDATQKYFELIGYWTAKEENRVNNPGGLAMKKRGERNKEVIQALLADLQIKSLGVFRTNKALRKKFYDMAKQLTDCDSEDRVSKIARLILNGKPVLALQKKP